MRSAWGIEHGEVSKAFKKLSPKLYRALESLPAYEKQDMKTRMKYNALHIRGVAGNAGAFNRTPKMAVETDWSESNRKFKRMAQASVRGHEAITRREGRKLP